MKNIKNLILALIIFLFSVSIYTQNNPHSLNINKIINGVEKIYGDISNFNHANIVKEIDIKNNNLLLLKKGKGNDWITSPEFIPTGNNLINIEFNIEFLKLGNGISIWIADSVGVNGKYEKYKIINKNGHYRITFDPAYYTVYKNYEKFRVWINNEALKNDQEMIARISDLKIYELENGVNSEIINGKNAKELFESTDSAISELQSKLSLKKDLISSSGKRFELSIDSSGNVIAIPIIPNKAVFFGNSLLYGFNGYGMASSTPNKDYHHLITKFIKSINPIFTSRGHSATSFESLENINDINSNIQTTFLDKLSGDEDLIVIQLGDNVNTSQKINVFKTSSVELCKRIRSKCQNARVVWIGMWYGTTSKYYSIKNACITTGCTFISFSNLISENTKNKIGNLTKEGIRERTLKRVLKIVENTATNITVTFMSGTNKYTTTLNVSSFRYINDVLIYNSEYRIISVGGVASHPNDEGFRKIANKFLKEMEISNDSQQYKK